MPPTDVNQALKLLYKWGSDRGGWGLVSSKVGGRGCCGVNAKRGIRFGGQGGCEPKIELIVKMRKQIGRGGAPVGGGGGGGSGWL